MQLRVDWRLTRWVIAAAHGEGCAEQDMLRKHE
jgi:hypothetical protein